MTRLLAVALALFVLLPVPSASAQLLAAKSAPIAYGHTHLNVTSVDEAKKFWVNALGGVLVKVGPENREVIKFPNELILLRAQKPTAGTKGSSVDHIAFSVANLRQLVDRLKAGGYRMVTETEKPANVTVVKDDIGAVDGGGVSGIAYVMGPDDVKVEMVEMKAQTAPIAAHHVHFAGANNEMRDWYVKVFGAEARPAANPAFISAGIPGMTLNFTPAAPQAPTQGRALDHIGFEVKNLEAFLKKLETQGIKPTQAYREVPALGLHVAFLVDPFGTNIELTEGFDKIE